MDSNERSDAKEKAQSLTSVDGLQRMIMSKMDEKDHPSAPLDCWYPGAIGYRLAEARDLKIGQEYAVDLSNDQYLVKALLDSGFVQFKVRHQGARPHRLRQSVVAR